MSGTGSSPADKLASLYRRLAPVFGASLTRGADDVHTMVTRRRDSRGLDAVIVFCGTPAEARQEAALIKAGARNLGFELEGGVEELESVTSHVEHWPKNGNLIKLSYRMPSRSGPIKQAAA